MLKIGDLDIRLKHINEINRITKKNGVVAFILGAGVYARALTRYLREHGLESDIKYVVDDIFIKSENVDCYPAISTSEFMDIYSTKAPLIFGIYNYYVVLEKRKQFKSKVKYMFDFHITAINDQIVDLNRTYFQENLNKFEETYNMLLDINSQRTMQYYLDAAINGDFDKLFFECRDQKMYFEGRLKDSDLEKMFDCGAFDGDSIHDFVVTYPDYKRIYAFEPDKVNIEKIKERISNEGIHDLYIIDKGVWSETTTLHFEADGTSMSSISETGEQMIEVIKLDDMYDSFDKKSLIKMDIEGSELEALKGAQRIIREISPPLAICVYHKREDLITIPQYIDSLVSNDTYNYYLGYQGFDLAELVFYAIPR